MGKIRRGTEGGGEDGCREQRGAIKMLGHKQYLLVLCVSVVTVVLSARMSMSRASPWKEIHNAVP